jgi:hypothetical protein
MTALDRQAALLEAMVTALGADALLAGLVGRRIYDAAPGRLVTPAVTLKLVSGSDASTADTEAQLFTFDVDVWDRYALGTDLSQPRAIMGHLRRILHLQSLPVPGCNLVLLRCTAERGPLRDPDEITLHGVVTVTALAGHEAAG